MLGRKPIFGDYILKRKLLRIKDARVAKLADAPDLGLRFERFKPVHNHSRIVAIYE